MNRWYDSAMILEAQETKSPALMEIFSRPEIRRWLAGAQVLASGPVKVFTAPPRLTLDPYRNCPCDVCNEQRGDSPKGSDENQADAFAVSNILPVACADGLRL